MKIFNFRYFYNSSCAYICLLQALHNLLSVSTADGAVPVMSTTTTGAIARVQDTIHETLYELADCAAELKEQQQVEENEEKDHQHSGRSTTTSAVDSYATFERVAKAVMRLLEAARE